MSYGGHGFKSRLNLHYFFLRGIEFSLSFMTFTHHKWYKLDKNSFCQISFIKSSRCPVWPQRYLHILMLMSLLKIAQKFYICTYLLWQHQVLLWWQSARLIFQLKYVEGLFIRYLFNSNSKSNSKSNVNLGWFWIHMLDLHKTCFFCHMHISP